MIEVSRLSRRLVQGRKQADFFPGVVLAEASNPCGAVGDKVFTVGGSKVWSVLVDAVEAADEGIVGEGDARGVDGEGVVLRENFVSEGKDGWMDGWMDGSKMALG